MTAMTAMSLAMFCAIQSMRRARAGDWDNYYVNPPAGMVILAGLIDTTILVTVFFGCCHGCS